MQIEVFYKMGEKTTICVRQAILIALHFLDGIHKFDEP